MLAALLTHTHTHPHKKNNEKIMKKIMENPNIRRKEHTSLIHVRSTSITIQILIVIVQRKRNFLLTLLNAATDDQEKAV